MVRKGSFRIGFFLLIMLFILTNVIACSSADSQKQEDNVQDKKNTQETEKWSPEQIEIVLPHKVGSNQDMTTRILGEVWAAKLGTTFVYNNKDGASGQIGYNYFQTLPKDGSVIMSSNLASASIMYKEQTPPWDWEETLIWMGIFGIDPGTFFVRANSPYETINQLIDEAKNKKLTVAISYWASPDNLLLHQIMEQTGAQFEIIPYGSGNDLVTQVMGGHVDFGYTKVSGVEKAGDLRHLAISMPENPIPHLTNDAPALDEALGTKTLLVASYRAVNVHKELMEKYPERYQSIKETFEEAKDDPRVIESMKKAGADPDLMVDWDEAELMNQTRMYWEAFEKYKDIYTQEK
ncbi:MAG: tripartite tricarboxylate transporter substrate-binding protein [Peptococcaceae bacterium]